MNQKGFTLIELLVVVAIVTVLPLIVVSDFPRIRLQFSLSRASHAFAQEVRATQDRALSSTDFVDQFGIPQPISGFGIYVDPSTLGPTSYLVYADAFPGNSHYDPLDYVVKTVDFSEDEPGIIIASLQGVTGQSASINFTPPNPDVSIAELDGQSRQVEVIFSLENDPLIQKTVTMNTAGLIQIK